MITKHGFRLIAALSVLTVACTACGPPGDTYHVGFSRVQTNLVLRDLPAKQQPPRSPLSLPVPAPPGSQVVPSRSFVRAVAPAAEADLPAPAPSAAARAACPTSTHATPAMSAPVNPIGSGPAPGIYSYGVEGSYSTTGSTSMSGTYDRVLQVAISKPVTQPDHSVRWTATARVGMQTTITTYSLGPTPNGPNNPDETSELAIVAIRRQSPGQPDALLRPAQPIALIGFPIVNGRTYTTKTTDSDSLTAVEAQVTVDGNETVMVCGQAFDTWKISGSLVVEAPGGGDRTDLTVDVAPQFGTLLLRSTFASSSVASGGVTQSHATQTLLRLAPMRSSTSPEAP